jgi:hypothetical protein
MALGWYMATSTPDDAEFLAFNEVVFVEQFHRKE